MADQKLSQLTTGGAIAATDLFYSAEDMGGGNYAQVKQTASALRVFIGRIKLTANTTFYVSNFSGTITAGSGYTNGTYINVPMTGGTGSGATCDIVVAGGAVTVVRPRATGSGFAVNDALTVSTAIIGGGTLFAFTITAIGVDSTTGVQGTVALSPWKTPQFAYNTLTANYDACGFTATIQCADGVYVGGVILNSVLANCPALTFNGNSGDYSKVVWQDSNAEGCPVATQAGANGAIVFMAFIEFQATSGVNNCPFFNDQCPYLFMEFDNVGLTYAVPMTGTFIGADAGTGYTAGTYYNKAFTTTTGVGTGARADFTIAGGAVTVVRVYGALGSGYLVGDTLSVLNTDVGGTGSAFKFTITSLSVSAAEALINQGALSDVYLGVCTIKGNFKGIFANYGTVGTFLYNYSTTTMSGSPAFVSWLFNVSGAGAGIKFENNYALSGSYTSPMLLSSLGGSVIRSNNATAFSAGPNRSLTNGLIDGAAGSNQSNLGLATRTFITASVVGTVPTQPNNSLMIVNDALLILQPIASGSLPAASTCAGARAVVNNHNVAIASVVFGSTVGTGGSTVVPVFSDGTNWRLG